jgi:hypothetical protein
MRQAPRRAHPVERYGKLSHLVRHINLSRKVSRGIGERAGEPTGRRHGGGDRCAGRIFAIEVAAPELSLARPMTSPFKRGPARDPDTIAAATPMFETLPVSMRRQPFKERSSFPVMLRLAA